MQPMPENGTEKTLAGATPALRRAAQRARRVAARTGTPLVLGKAGRIEKRWLGDEAAALREDSAEYKTPDPDMQPPRMAGGAD